MPQSRTPKIVSTDEIFENACRESFPQITWNWAEATEDEGWKMRGFVLCNNRWLNQPSLTFFIEVYQEKDGLCCGQLLARQEGGEDVVVFKTRKNSTRRSVLQVLDAVMSATWN